MTFPYVLRKGAIYEPVFWLPGPQASIYDGLGIVPQRTGNADPWPLPATRTKQLTAAGSGCPRRSDGLEVR
ncbi:MAG TPA: hypothetical protein VGL46_19565 [Pseudonocardiaceae bacterium]